MNIFYLDKDIKKSVQYHCDKHVVKMVIESIQLLATAYYTQFGFISYDNLEKQDLKMMKEDVFKDFPRNPNYRISHVHHPSSKWVSSSIKNWNWLLEFGLELSKEYTRRYNREHATHKCYIWMKNNPPKFLQNTPWTHPPLCMPDIYKSEDYVKSYRLYYFKEKSHFAVWNKLNNKPQWFSNMEKLIT